MNSSDTIKMNFTKLGSGLESFIIGKKNVINFRENLDMITNELNNNWQNDTGNDISSMNNVIQECKTYIDDIFLPATNKLIETLNNLTEQSNTISFTNKSS